jgi:hypothetical protein
VLDDAAVKLVENDITTTNGVTVQQLANATSRTTWSPARVLLIEQTDRFDDPLGDNCYATPQALAESIKKIDALHPDCFPHDGAGNPLLPPVIIEPGVDFVKWYDDRFIISFVHTENPRPGAKLALSPVDLAVMRIYGQFTARGELYDYRGDRLTGNFIADYAGEVKSKAKVKFSGDKGKMTIVSSSELADGAGREEAVEDYIDFIHLVTNGLPVPKRITPRRIGVMLEYCTINGVDATVAYALRFVMAHDNMQVRKILQRVLGTSMKRLVEGIKKALDSDPQVATRFRRSLDTAVKEVMGSEFYRDAQNKGLLGGAAAAAAAQQPDSGDGEDGEDGGGASGHDYFDV